MLSLGTLSRSIASLLGYTLPLHTPSEGNSPFNLSTATLTDLRRLLTNETVTSAFLIEQYLAQIENHKLKATHTITPTAPKADLIEQARCLDDERMDGHIRGPMHGIPVLIENTQQTESENDAPLINILTKAGMIPIGTITPSLLPNSKTDAQPLPETVCPALFLPLTITHSIDSPLTHLASALGLYVMHPTTAPPGPRLAYGAIAKTAQDIVAMMAVLTDKRNSAPLRGNAWKSDT